MKENYIYLGDCVEIIEKEIDKESIDLIYADPPYNLSGRSLNLINNNTGGSFYKMNERWDTWDYEEYIKFTRQWIKKCRDILKPIGSIYISCTYHNLAEIIIESKKIGLKLNNIITWYKVNAMPSITKRTFTHSTEFVCWFVKGKGWKFNYFQLKEWNPQKTKDGKSKQLRDFIVLPIVQGQERMKGENGRALHPTQKPEKLIELILTASSDENDLVLDPFFGTGTTGIVASKLGRRWIGIEANKEYFNIANKRIFEGTKKYVKQ